MVSQLHAMRSPLAVRVRAVLDDGDPALRHSTIGQVVQAEVLVRLAADLLPEHTGHESACLLIAELARGMAPES